MIDIEQEAENYAESVCSDTNIVDNAKYDFIAGAECYKQHVLSVLIENYAAVSDLTDEDKARSAQDMLNEVYEDLIAIFEQN